MTAIPRYRHRLARRLSWLVIASLTSVALFAPGTLSVSAASVVPIPINDGNPTCADFKVPYGGGQNWLQSKQDPPGNGTITVAGFGTITVSNFQQSSSGTPGSFNWTSTFGIDAVFVKAGNDKHNLYVYAPTAASAESFGDTGLQAQAGQGNGLSHISFCYDTTNPQPTEAPTNPPTEAPTNPPTDAPTNPPTEAPTNPPTEAPTNPPTEAPTNPPTEAPTNPPTEAPTNPPTEAPTNPPTEAPTQAPTEAPTVAPTEPPTGGVGGATGTPAGAGTTLPPTDSLGDPATAPGSDAWRLVLLALAGTLAGALLLTPARSVRKDR